mgnify:CR=1 FL=1
MKKFLALLLSLSMVLALSACGGTKSDDDNAKGDETKTDAPAETATDFKVGFIMLHDENSTYDLNFINAAKEACETLGVEYTIVTNVPEGQECYDKAAELADAGCNIIFSDSYGHQTYMLSAAEQYPAVTFVACTGDQPALLVWTISRTSSPMSMSSLCIRRCGRHEAQGADGCRYRDRPLCGLCGCLPLCRGGIWLHRVPAGHSVHRARGSHGRSVHQQLV